MSSILRLLRVVLTYC